MFERLKEDQGRKGAVLVTTRNVRKRGRGHQEKKEQQSSGGACSGCSKKETCRKKHH